MRTKTIQAADYCGAEQSVVESAKRIAGVVVDELDEVETVRVSMQGVPGAASSFFNVILRAVAGYGGSDAVRSRLQFEFSSKVQEMLYSRSRDAVLRQPG